MVDENLFEPILDNDEKIVETFKPNKMRFIWLPTILLFILIAIFITPVIFIIASEGSEELYSIFYVLGFFVLLACLYPVIMGVRYKKTIYCYTNKRFLFRTGFIGADYQAIDFDLIGAMNVRVDFLDKLVKPNTGSITFASAASPIVQGGQMGATSAYCFKHIQNPYEVYKRVKEFSGKNKDGKFNS